MKRKPLGKAGQFSQKQIDANALELLKVACEKMTGKDTFKMFTPLCKARMIGNRLPALKLKISNDVITKASDFKFFNEIFVEQLNCLEVKTLTGEYMTLGQYLREGMNLVCYSEIIQELGAPNADAIAAAFQGYQRVLFTRPIFDLVELLYRLSTLLTDWGEFIFEYDIQNVFGFSGDSTANHVCISLKRPQSISVVLDGIKREVIPVQWPKYSGNCNVIHVNPKDIGLALGIEAKQLSVPVYIQQHAIKKLQERTGIHPGLAQHALYAVFKETSKLAAVSQGKTSLVEYHVYGQKLGYLVCCYQDHKVIIRTFLFLTNDGTPEGKRLFELTRLALLDKQYLGIDTLSGFMKFRIAEDINLKALFFQAGCESLFDLTLLEKFQVSEVRIKDPTILLNYLKGIPITEDGYSTILPWVK